MDSFLLEITESVDEAIDKVCDKHCIDRAYYRFILKCNELTSDFKKLKDHTLIDGHDGWCGFCGAKTYYYDNDYGYMCIECKIKSDKIRGKR